MLNVAVGISAGVGALTSSIPALQPRTLALCLGILPLFAVGAFLTFTMSQLGRVAHWRREGARKHWYRLAINALGVATTIVALVIIAAKFVDGSWLVVLAIPLTMGVLFAVHRYYARLTARLAAGNPLRSRRTSRRPCSSPTSAATA